MLLHSYYSTTFLNTLKNFKTRQGLSRTITKLVFSVASWMHQPFLNYNLNTSGEGLDRPASNSHIWQCQKSNIWLLLPSTVRERCQGSTEPRSDLAQPPSRREGGSKQSLSQLRVGKFKSGGFFFFFLHLHYHG